MELLVSSLMLYQAGLALRRGNVTEALATAQTAADQASSTGRLPYALTLDTIRIDALLAQGRIEDAERIAAVHSVAGQAEVAWERPRFLMSLAALRIAQGELRAGLSLLRECGHHCEAAGTVSPAMAPWRSRSVGAHLALGRPRRPVRWPSRSWTSPGAAGSHEPSGWRCGCRGWPRVVPAGWTCWPRPSRYSAPPRPASNSPVPWATSGPP